MRKLASIQKIVSIESIVGADSIDKATVLGWQLVVKKGEFKIGDLCVYVEIDSILPEKPEFEFLRNKNFRIKTLRLRGQISQGICFPTTILGIERFFEEGDDVTNILAIIKYEPPIPACLSGVMKGGFPSFIPKTDETRVQVLQTLLDEHKGKQCFITEKVDGSSATYFMKDKEFGVCSRNMELMETTDNTYWKMARALDIENKLARFGKNIALQGELIGEGIQGNKLKRKGHTVLFFNLFFIDEYRYAGYNEWLETLDQLDLPNVPIIADNYILANDLDGILKMSERSSMIETSAMAEGIIIRVKDIEEHVSFKAISNEFLIKYGE